jgi:hypothetical protein
MAAILDLSSGAVLELFNAYLGYCTVRSSVFQGEKARLPNFPEDVSENIVKFVIRNVEQRECFNAKKGDLVSGGKQIEVKCFVSDGPSSFGPNEEFNQLYFVDATRFTESIFRVYRVNLTSQSTEWNKVKVNKTTTMRQQRDEKRRPRISFSELQKQIPRFIELIYEGTIQELLQ